MQINRLARVAAAAALGASFCFAAAPALAAGGDDDPAGANGTIKVDALEFDTKIHNEPHVTCEFRVKFFNFDADEHGNIVFSAQRPSGDFQEVLRLDNELLSNDKAAGGNPDPDEIYSFTADDLDLAGLTAQPQQGYHIKLTVERIGAPGAGKHKVFWLQPCAQSSSPTSPSMPTSPSTPPSSGGGGGGGQSGGGLPITGVAASSIAVAGVGLIGAGAVLVIRRRRKFVA